MSDAYQTFHIGINIFAVRDNRLLLGKRKNVYGAGTWGLPGGHLEVGEGMLEAAARELMEETGLRALKYEYINTVNDRHGQEQYIQIGFLVSGIEGDVELKEPDRCAEWQWFKLGALPDDIFPAHKNQIQLFLDKKNFSDT